MESPLEWPSSAANMRLFLLSFLNMIHLMVVVNRQGVPEDDLQALGRALESDGARADKEFGPKVKEWIGSMIQKAAKGTWDIALKTAPSVITKSLESYYGW